MDSSKVDKVDVIIKNTANQIKLVVWKFILHAVCVEQIAGIAASHADHGPLGCTEQCEACARLISSPLAPSTITST